MGVVGYVTVAEATEYVRTRYPATDELRKAWEALQPADQTVYLQRSFDIIELLPFRGRKTDKQQETAFPRYPSTEVPRAIKYAQIENALGLADETLISDTAFYEKLFRYGVESYSIGNLSESTSNGSWGHVGTESAERSLSTAQALAYVRPFLMGGFSVE